MGASPDLCVTLMELEFVFDGEKIWVSSAWHGEDVYGVLFDLLLALWRLENWSDSRWVTSGTGLRMLLLAQQVQT